MRKSFNDNLTFDQINSVCCKASDAERVLALVKHYPFRTSRELADKYAKLSADSIHKRLPELLKANRIVKSSNRRQCTITHKAAHTWGILNQA